MIAEFYVVERLSYFPFLFTWNRHKNFVDGVNNSIGPAYVSICHASVIYYDLSFPVHFNINEVSLNRIEPAVVHCGWVEWLRQHVVLDKSLQKRSSVVVFTTAKVLPSGRCNTLVNLIGHTLPNSIKPSFSSWRDKTTSPRRDSVCFWVVVCRWDWNPYRWDWNHGT